MNLLRLVSIWVGMFSTGRQLIRMSMFFNMQFQYNFIDKKPHTYIAVKFTALNRR